jgi:hypothetical protein
VQDFERSDIGVRRPGGASLGAALFTALFAAAVLTAALVVRERDPALALEVTNFSAAFEPDGDGERDVARLEFFTRESDPAATVAIVGRNLEPVRRLAEDVSLEADREVTYTWDGRTDEGGRAPPGRYRLRVVLPGSERDVVFRRRIDLLPSISGTPVDPARDPER